MPAISPKSFVRQKSRTFKSYNIFASVLVFALYWTSHNSSTLNHAFTNVYEGNTLNQQILRLCDMDQEAQDSHSYPKHMEYLKAWIGEIAGGTVRMKSLAPENHVLSVTVPQSVTQHQAKSRAKFYRIIYADVRKEYLPEDKANSCTVVIYNQEGKQLAYAEET